MIIVIAIVIAGGLSLWFLTGRSGKDTPAIIHVINQPRWSKTIELAVQQWNSLHPEQQVTLDQLIIGYPQLRNKLITACGAGKPPDISILDSVWLAEFAKAGQLAPLDEIDPEWFKDDYTNDFFPVFQHGDMFDGHLWGIRTQTDMAIIWYRKDWLLAENLNPPSTWNDLVKISRHFQTDSVRTQYGNSEYPLALPLGQKARETMVYQLLPLFWSNGGGIFRNGRLILDSGQNAGTLKFLRDLVHTYKVVSPESTTFEWNRAAKLFATGKAVLALGGSYEKSMIQEVSGWDNAEFSSRAGFALIPSGRGGVRSTTAGGMCYVVYEQSPNKKRAFEIIRLATSPEIMRQFTLETYQHPPRISVAEGLDKQKYPFLAETASYLYKARTRPVFPKYSRLSDLFQEMVETTVQEETEPGVALKETSRKVLGLMKRNSKQ